MVPDDEKIDASTLDDFTPPGKEYDLSHWKLTLPIDGAREVYPTELAIYASQYFNLDDGAMVFFCPSDGDTTPNAKYARSELREMVNPNDDNVMWVPTDGVASLSAGLFIDRVPGNGKVIFAQVHGRSRPLIKLQYENGTIYALAKLSPNSGKDKKYSLTSILSLDSLSISVDVDHIGVRIKANNALLELRFGDGLAAAWADEYMYFKAGCYPQDTIGAAQVAFVELSINHSDGTSTDSNLYTITKRLDEIDEKLGTIERFVMGVRSL